MIFAQFMTSFHTAAVIPAQAGIQFAIWFRVAANAA